MLLDTASPSDLLAAVRAAGHVVFDKGPGHRPFDLQIIGLRRDTGPDAFDDRIFVVYRDSVGTLTARSWAATTDPGHYWRRNPGKVRGTAILKAGQYRSAYRIGEHKGKPALVQDSQVTVWRDANRDTMIDIGLDSETGNFGINIHRAGLSSSVVDKWSAGCQVFASNAGFEEFLALCQKQVSSGGGSRFTYTLLEGV